MMNSFALQNIVNLTQGSGTALHPGRIPDGHGFPIFLAMEQHAAEQASIPSDAFSPDSDGQIVKALGNGQRIDLTKVTTAPESSIKHPVSSIKQSSNQAIKRRASSLRSQVSGLKSPVPSLLYQLSYLMSCAYPPANKVVRVI